MMHGQKNIKSYMYMFRASLAHHLGALQEVVCWCTLCMMNHKARNVHT